MLGADSTIVRAEDKATGASRRPHLHVVHRRPAMAFTPTSTTLSCSRDANTASAARISVALLTPSAPL